MQIFNQPMVLLPQHAIFCATSSVLADSKFNATAAELL